MVQRSKESRICLKSSGKAALDENLIFLINIIVYLVTKTHKYYLKELDINNNVYAITVLRKMIEYFTGPLKWRRKR